MSTQEDKNNSLISGILDCLRSSKLIKWILAALVLLALFVGFLHIPPKYTERTSIADYGNYDGTGNDEFTAVFIQSFFPETIMNSFSNIKYSYKAENMDTYGFEAYLEFVIEDESQFLSYISDITGNENWQDFAYAPGYKEYCLDDVLVLDDIDDGDDPSSIFYRQIIRAKIRKILYSPEEQRIIYVAIGVYDGGGIGTNYLNVFFDRFQIDPAEYEHTASSAYGVDPFGIS